MFSMYRAAVGYCLTMGVSLLASAAASVLFLGCCAYIQVCIKGCRLHIMVLLEVHFQKEFLLKVSKAMNVLAARRVIRVKAIQLS